MFSASLPVDTVMTLTTLTGQEKGSFPSVPPSAPFPLPYYDDFDSQSFLMSVIMRHLGKETNSLKANCNVCLCWWGHLHSRISSNPLDEKILGIVDIFRLPASCVSQVTLISVRLSSLLIRLVCLKSPMPVTLPMAK